MGMLSPVNDARSMEPMTATSPPNQDERPNQMANDRRAGVAAVAATWIGLAGLLWLVLRDAEPPGRAPVLALTIVASAAVTAHAVVALFGWSRLGPARWPAIAVVILACAWLAHQVLAGLGMVQSLLQDVVNMTVISGIALAVSQAWSGHQVRGVLAREALRRAQAEARLAEGRTRPSGLIPVRVGHGERMVDPTAISRIEADGNFTILHDLSGPIFVSEPMKAIVHRLEPCGFVRVHKSHAVNSEAVRERRRDALTLIDGIVVPIGRSYRS